MAHHIAAEPVPTTSVTIVWRTPASVRQIAAGFEVTVSAGLYRMPVDFEHPADVDGSCSVGGTA